MLPLSFSYQLNTVSIGLALSQMKRNLWHPHHPLLYPPFFVARLWKRWHQGFSTLQGLHIIALAPAFFPAWRFWPSLGMELCTCAIFPSNSQYTERPFVFHTGSPPISCLGYSDLVAWFGSCIGWNLLLGSGMVFLFLCFQARSRESVGIISFTLGIWILRMYSLIQWASIHGKKVKSRRDN